MKTIRGLALADTSRPDSLSTKFRRRRDVRLRALIQRLARNGPIHILDLGGSVEYWRRVGVPFLREHARRITVLNFVASELKPGEEDVDLFETMIGDACDLSGFATGGVELVHSNSVIEHVGDWSRMAAFANETRRVGRSYYVQTPNFWFPIDPHYYRAPLIHWFPRPWQAGLLSKFAIAHAGRMPDWNDAQRTIDGTRLLDARSIRTLFPDSNLVFERILGLGKSLIVIRECASEPHAAIFSDE